MRAVPIFALGLALGTALADARWRPQSAQAHEAMSGWSYDIFCCGGQDCYEIASHRVHEVQGGYMVDDHFYVPASQARKSGDGHYHACFPKPDELRRLYVPPSSF